jgi:hypothetical protein
VTEWRLTAKTVYCDAVDDDVTIMVYKDWNTKCTGYKNYGEGLNQKTAQLLKKKAKRLGRNLECEGPQDPRVTDYRDKIIRDKIIVEDKATPAPTKLTQKKRARH